MTCPLFVLGSANVDHLMHLPRLPGKGETVTGGTYLMTFGGKGANCAAAAAKAGGFVSFGGCIGEDGGGAALRQALDQYGVNTVSLRTLPGVATGSALVMVGRAGGNYLSVAPGANHAITPSMVEEWLSRVPDSGLVLLQNEIPEDANLAALEVLRARGMRCLFNFAPVVPFPLDQLRSVQWLVVNETEADSLLRTLGHDALSMTDPRRAACELRAFGSAGVVITLGGKGVVCSDSGGSWQVPSFPVKAVDTTAAGDTFCGAFAVALAEGFAAPEAVRFANAAAALSVQEPGAMVSSPRRAAIDAWLATASSTSEPCSRFPCTTNPPP